MGIFTGLMVFGILLIGTPIGLAAADIKIGGLATLIMIITGIVLTVLSTVLMVITKLYVKTKADEAFVRTGWGGPQAILDGGALVIPVIHQIVRITLRTIKLEVRRTNEDALLTKDKLRADLSGEFFVRVTPDKESILQASRCFGDQMMVQGYVKGLVEDKLVSALRSVAATKTLEELNTDRESFMKEVTENVEKDLKENGLTLETATISQLDQTDQTYLKAGNVFDAQGLRKIAEITQSQMTEKNQLERAGEQARKDQDVETRKKVLAMDQDQAEAEARQAAEIAKIQALQQQEAQQKAIEAQREVELEGVKKAQALEVADRAKQEAIIAATQQVEVAERAKQQAVEVAERAKQQAIAVAQQEQTAAEAELAKQEALREAERQAIKTVEITKTAERDKAKAVIDAQAKAEREYVDKQRAADAKAYEIEKEAQGRKQAADADAEAVTKKAKADADAKKMAAEAEKALAMVPVQVKSGEVDVEQKRVDVLKQELEARAESGKVAQDFELAQLQIKQEAEVRIAQAQAIASFGAKFETQLFGTPEDVARMTEKLFSGMGTANLVNGFADQVDEGVKQVIAGAAGKASDLIGAAASRLGGGQNGEPAEKAGDSDAE
jgi:uncharacterized membrane protein YqiK